MEGDVTANHVAAGGVTVTKVDGQEVVGSGEAIVGYVDSETHLVPTISAGAGDVGLVTIKYKGSDFAGAERHTRTRVAIS